MRIISNYSHFINEEWSKNDPIPEITKNSNKLGIILLGSPGIGKCLEYNTPILLNNQLVKIGNSIENLIPKEVEGEVSVPVSNFFVNSIDECGNIINNKVSYFYRGYSEKLIRFKTQTGADIKVTPTHPLLVSTINGDIIWKKSKDILKSDKISRPRNILNKIETVDKQLTISKEMSRIIGYGLSNGDFAYYKNKNSKYFNLTNKDQDIINDFKKCIEKESKNILTVKSKKMKHSVQFNNYIKKGKGNTNRGKFDFISRIEEICGSYIFSKKSYIVKIPYLIFQDLELLKNFLGSYLSCDGGVYNNRIEFYTTSDQISNEISYSLLKFGINSVKKDKMSVLNDKEFNSFIIRITGEDYNKFGLIFNKYISCKRKKIKIIKNTNSNIGGFIPCDEFVKIIKENKLIKKLKKDLGYKFSENIKFRRVLTKIRLNKIIDYLNNFGIYSEFIEKYKLIHNNLFFDKIESINNIHHDGYVYDVVLDSNHNFIGGNIPTILHNSTFTRDFIIPRNSNIKTFSTDDVSIMFSKDPNKYHEGTSELNIRRLKGFIKTGQSFIYDTTGTHEENIIDIYNLSKENGYTIILIHLIGPLHTAIDQNKERERQVPEDYIKMAYDKQFKNISMYSKKLNPDGYYIVQKINDKYKFSKYSDGEILKRKVDRYVKESTDVKDEIGKIMSTVLDFIDDGYDITFKSPTGNMKFEEHLIGNGKFNPVFKAGKYERSQFSIVFHNNKKLTNYDDFLTICDDMKSSIGRLKDFGWNLYNLKVGSNPRPNNQGDANFSYVSFEFSKPDILTYPNILPTNKQIRIPLLRNGIIPEDITIGDNSTIVEFELDDRWSNRLPEEDGDEIFTNICDILGFDSFDWEVGYNEVKFYY